MELMFLKLHSTNVSMTLSVSLFAERAKKDTFLKVEQFKLVNELFVAVIVYKSGGSLSKTKEFTFEFFI